MPQLYRQLVEIYLALHGTKRQPLQEFMTPCATQLNVGRAMIIHAPKNPVQFTVFVCGRLTVVIITSLISE